MSTTLDKSRMSTLADKHREQEEDNLKRQKSERKKVEDTKGRTLETKKTKNDRKTKGK